MARKSKKPSSKRVWEAKPERILRRVAPRRRRKDALRRARPYKPVNIAEVVYGFLGNVAVLQAERMRKEFGRFRARNKRGARKTMFRRRRRVPTGERDAEGPREATETMTKTRRPGTASSTSASSISTGGTGPIPITSTARSAVKTTKTLLKRRSLIQVINSYIKAGIAEGKRRAKRYVRKALSFGVDSGYLIPTDPGGQVLRVSSALTNFDARHSRKRREERGSRRRMRRGEECSDAKASGEARSSLNPSRRRGRGKGVDLAQRKRARSDDDYPGSALVTESDEDTSRSASETRVRRTIGRKKKKRQNEIESEKKGAIGRPGKRRRSPVDPPPEERDSTICQRSDAQHPRDNVDVEMEEAPELRDSRSSNSRTREEMTKVKNEEISDDEEVSLNGSDEKNAAMQGD